MTRRSIYLPFVIFAGILCIARFNDPPDGNTGAPGESTCVSCHSPGNPNGYNGSISVSGLPAPAMAGVMYPLTVTVSNPGQTAIRGGFQMVALNESNQNAGTFSNPGPSSKLSTSGGRSYHEHNPGRAFNGNQQISWTVTWTAPNVQGTEDVTFYAAGLVANGNNNNSGDLTVASETTVQVQGNAPPLSVVITSMTNPDCFGASTGSATAQASGGTPPYDYVWSTGGNLPTETNMPAGTHTVMVFDQAAGNTQTSVMLTDPPQLNGNLNVLNPIRCPDGSDGALQAQASGGVPPYNYQWSTGQSGNTITNLSSGLYSLTIEDGNACQIFQDIFLNDPPEITFETVEEPVLCHGESSGIGEIINVRGGNQGPYAFSWSDGFNNTGSQSIRNNLAEGTYRVTITDRLNCSVETELSIGSPSPLNVAGEVTPVRCHGEENGGITLSVSGGTPMYGARWNDGSTSLIREDLSPGNYNVTVTDANGCIEMVSYQISEPDTLDLIVDTILNSQCGEASGLIRVAPIGGYTPYEYDWSNGDSLSFTDSLVPGEYTLVTTDSLGCTRNDTFQIIIADNRGPDIIADDIRIYLDESGEYQVTESDLTYMIIDSCSDSISTRFILPLATCADLSDTLIGTIIAEDDLGNMSSKDFFIHVSDTIFPEWLSLPPSSRETVCEGLLWYEPSISGADNCDSIQLIQTGGPAVPDSLGIGTYRFSFELRDQAGNAITYEWSLEVLASMISGELDIQNPSCPGFADGSVTFTPSDPEIIRSVNLVPDLQQDSLPAGSYRLVIADTSGCFATYSFTLEDPDSIMIIDPLITPASAPTNADGSISVVVQGGTMPFEYAWYDGDPANGGTTIGTNEPLIQNLLPGQYFLIITDANGCTEIFSFIVGTGTSTGNPQNVNYKLFPNPTDGILYIQTDSPFRTVRIFRADGSEVVSTFGKESSSLDLTGLETGIYFVRIEWIAGGVTTEVIQVSSGQ